MRYSKLSALACCVHAGMLIGGGWASGAPGPVVLAEYAFDGVGAAAKLEASTAPGVTAEALGELGDVDDEPSGLKRFRGRTLMLKDNALNADFDDGESSLVVAVASADGSPLGLTHLRLTFGGIDDTPYWGYRVYGEAGAGERELHHAGMSPAGGIAQSPQLIPLAGMSAASEATLRIEFADDHSGMHANYTLRLAGIELLAGAVAGAEAGGGAHGDATTPPAHGINELQPLAANRPQPQRELLGGDAELPNVVLVLVDDLGFGTPGCYGGNGPATPNIDRLAREGLRFTRAYTPTSICTPARYALLQGEYAWRGPTPGVVGNTGLILDPSRTTLPDVFQRAGYVTAGFGKWNLGLGPGDIGRKTDFGKPLRPGTEESGFDYFFGIPVMHAYPPHVYFENDHIWNADPDDPLVWSNRGERARPEFRGAVKSRLTQAYVTTEFNRRIERFIRDNADRRFFLYYPMTNPHTPFEPHPRFRDGGAWGDYGDYLREMDAALGSLLEVLDELELAADTLVIFTSDNGGIGSQHGALRQLGQIDSNAPLRGDKGDLYEGGLRIPFIVRWPGESPAGETSAQPLQFNDLLATFASLTGQRLAADDARDSFDMLPALRGGQNLHPARTLVFQGRGRFLAAQRDGWKFLATRGSGDWKHADPESYTGDGPDAQLYHIDQDGTESNNLIEADPRRAAELERALEAATASAATRR